MSDWTAPDPHASTADGNTMRQFTRRLFGRPEEEPQEAAAGEQAAIETAKRKQGNVVSAEGRHHGEPSADDFRDFTRRLFGREND